MEEIKLEQYDTSKNITPIENQEINQRVDFELHNAQCKMIKVGGITNIVMGLFIIWVFYGQVKFVILMSWYAILFTINGINMGLNFYYQAHKPTPQEIQKRLRTYHIILVPLCLTWSSIGVLFVIDSTNLAYQLFAIAFLLIVLVGFSIGTGTDFTASILSITSLLIPPIVFHAYTAIESILSKSHNAHLDIAFVISLVNTGIFLLLTCYIAHELIKRSFRLTFINVMLNKKLENINKFLEERVKERTIELEKSLELVKYQATHDLLTNLPNHRYMIEHLEKLINVARKENRFVYVAFFSLNEMDKINDGLGHYVGNFIIQTISKRLQNIFKEVGKNFSLSRYTITLSRRDEFVILLELDLYLEDIEKISNIFFGILEKVIHIENQMLKLTGSIGVSVYPQDGEDVKTLLMNADAAMVNAKQWGGNKFIKYKPEINANLSRQIELEGYLNDALKNNEFKLYYQPFVDVLTEKICGAEALIRWKNPVLGFVSPMRFIYIAEANGMIIPLGEWVLREAFTQTKAWHEQGFTTLKVAVNLSAKQLQQENIVKTIEHILKEADLDPQFIELELTETEAFKEEAVPVLKRLKAIGFNLSIDDFGTGYSGLKNLKLFAIDKLKIDRAFIQDVDTNIESKTIVSNIVSLAKKMGITVLSEGVETEEQLAFLQKIGCDLIQGYYFSPPVPVEEFTKLLSNGLGPAGISLD